jgi:hypothetical protein
VTSRNNAVLIGGLIGAVLGATAAWAYTRSQESKLPADNQSGRPMRLQARLQDYVKIGMSLLTLVRQVADLLKPT